MGHTYTSPITESLFPTVSVNGHEIIFHVDCLFVHLSYLHTLLTESRLILLNCIHASSAMI